MVLPLFANGRDKVSMWIKVIPRDQMSILEKSSVSGKLSLFIYSGAMNYLVPSKKPFRNSGSSLNLALSNGIEYEKSITRTESRFLVSIMFQGLRS
jgi:hypothetical protein